MLQPNIGLAKTTCDEALEANEAALAQCLVTIEKKDEQILQYQISINERDRLLRETQSQLREERESQQSLLKNPIVLIGIGLLAGAIIFK